MLYYGFLSYEDFLSEVAVNPPQGGVVRVEAVMRQRPVKNGPSPMLAHEVVIAARLSSDEVAVCRILIGEEWAIFARDSKGQPLRENAARAYDIVTADLAARGFEIRRGLPAGVSRVHVTATCGLWRWERHDGQRTLVAHREEAACTS